MQPALDEVGGTADEHQTEQQYEQPDVESEQQLSSSTAQWGVDRGARCATQPGCRQHRQQQEGEKACCGLYQATQALQA